jgi:hypothetical protein
LGPERVLKVFLGAFFFFTDWTEQEVGKLAPAAPIPVFGIVGFTQLSSGTSESNRVGFLTIFSSLANVIFHTALCFLGVHLIVITNKMVGLLEGEPVYKIVEVSFFPVSATPAALSDSQKKQEAAFIGELNKLLTDKYFFFSYTHDLSNTLQRRQSMTAERLSEPLHKRFDNRFFWNKSMMEGLIKLEYSEWILPIMRGKYVTNLAQDDSLLYFVVSHVFCRTACNLSSPSCSGGRLISS